jgi:hypothetical protein
VSDHDKLSIEDGLYGGGLSAEQVIAAYAAVIGGAVVFDFGISNTLTLQGVGTLVGLAGLMDLV